MLILRSMPAAVVVVGAAMMGLPERTHAGIVWSGIVNINIPSNIDGVYVNVNTGQTGSASTTVPGWDISIFGSSVLNFRAPDGSGYVTGLGSSTALVDNLAIGTLIAPRQVFGDGAFETTGPTAAALNSSENLVGFRFMNETTGALHYGWMRIQFTGTSFSQPRAIVDYAYESVAGTAIGAGVIIPAPGGLALVAVAMAHGRRRR